MSHSLSLYHRANDLLNSNHPAKAIPLYRECIKLSPNQPEPHHNLALALARTGRFDAAIAAYHTTIKLAPAMAIAHYNLGNLYLQLSQNRQAVEQYRHALRLQPRFFEALLNLGIAQHRLNQNQPAIASFKQALTVKNHPDAYNNLGMNLVVTGDLKSAISYFKSGHEQFPSHTPLLSNYIRALQMACLWTALPKLNRQLNALTQTELKAGIKPGDSPFNCLIRTQNLKLHYQIARAHAASIQKQVNPIPNPHSSPSSHSLSSLSPPIASREGGDEETCPPNWRGDKVSLTTDNTPISPVISSVVEKSLSFPLNSPQGQTLVAQGSDPALRPFPKSLPLHKGELGGDVAIQPNNLPLRLGYLSYDFRDHAVAHHIWGVFRHHDHKCFTIHTYSTGPNDHSWYRQTIQQHSNQFTDLSATDLPTAIDTILRDRIDILIDLNGHTTGTRLEILAARPAPIQATWLGYSGTTGADFIDYLITDRIITPPDHAPYYSEKFAYLPHTVQPNSYPPISIPQGQTLVAQGSDPALHPVSRHTLRLQHHLPTHAFVFCSFNLAYKLDPDTFQIWLSLLQAVPHSVLWLFNSHPLASDNLRRLAAKASLNPRRLIFAPKVPLPDHLNRLSLADLALDTPQYNGGTTTSNALWAGVPVITILGKHFPSRTAASLLTAANLPQLITHDLKEYQSLALNLATHPDKLKVIRSQLKAGQRLLPLFDTRRFTRDLEALYLAMYHRHSLGLPPAIISALHSKG